MSTERAGQPIRYSSFPVEAAREPRNGDPVPLVLIRAHKGRCTVCDDSGLCEIGESLTRGFETGRKYWKGMGA